ncbi:MAG: polyribonucleotide nucleotidyltransferase [Bacteroidetes bacterium]|nr:polyribonucleotide nucleotidyltransferase [Bacteroidota bacterium]
MAKITTSVTFNGKEYSLETGKLAKFANSVMVSCGETIVLVTVVASEKELEGIDFLPMQVEYREKYAAAGKIPGGFLKRETRPTDHEVLCARLIDRPIRPMITKSWHHETQIIANVYSAEPDVNPDSLAAVAASAALLISDIPFEIPVSQVRVGRVNGTLIANPNDAEMKQCDIDLSVSGTDQAIMMVEGEMKEISEDVFVEALDFAHNKIRELNALQMELVRKFEAENGPVVKRKFKVFEIPEEIVNVVENAIKEDLNNYVHTVSTKKERHDKRIEIKEKAIETLTTSGLDILKDVDAILKPDEPKQNDAEPTPVSKELCTKWCEEIVSKLEKKLMREMILTDKIRLDGRKLDQIRPIECEVGLLPRNHGSALFTRGETQSLTSLTLGTSRDEQVIDGLLPEFTERFILHYNFPPFSVGETGRMMTGRREIGHGHLAWRSLKEVLPPQDTFPYTLRLVSDILESNGSSSMATVCAGSLAMFNAGVPVKGAVAGIAMGLIKEEERVAILSDILGDEDFLGDMDFKVAGTQKGITACQMDIKIDEGLSTDFMRNALEQAKQGRMHILGVMNECIKQPEKDLSKYAPRYVSIKIPVDTIGAVIGTGGETIRAITKETGVEINIEDDGTVLIASISKEASDSAIKIIRGLTQKPEVGEVYKNVLVKEVRDDLGLIVEFMPKTTGLVHISQLAKTRINKASMVAKPGDRIDVKLIEISRDGKYRLSRKVLLK